jgi:hypothetical protein
MATALEVFEHFEDPLGEAKKLLTYSDNLLLSTILLPAYRPRPGEWWYYALDTGQHISIYTKRSLKALAGRLNLRLYSNGRSIHLLTRKLLPEKLFFILIIGPVSSIYWSFFSLGRKSLQESDYFTSLVRDFK